MLQQTFVTQPFKYRLPSEIPVTAWPLIFYFPALTTPPRIYGEEWDGGPTAIFLNPEDLADGYQVIWLGFTQNMIRFPSWNYTWHRFNGSTGAYLGRVDAPIFEWLTSIFGQSRDGTLWKLKNGTKPFQAFPCAVTATSVTPSSTASFDFSNFEGVIELNAFSIDAEQNLLLACINVDSSFKVWNLTTGALIRTIALPSFGTVVMPVDERQCYVMTETGIICLIDYQAGAVISTFAVQANGSTSAFSTYKTITYDQTYRRFLSWNYTPVDGSGQNTSVIQGFYPVPIAVGMTKPIPLRAPRNYRSVPILNRIYGDMGEATGGGVVSLAVADPTLGSIVSFPALTDIDGESIGSLSCLAAGAPTITATTITTGVGGTGGSGAPPPPPPLPSSVRQPGDFPRLGGYLVSGSSDYDNPTRQAQIAKLDVAVLAFPPAWVGSSGASMEYAVIGIKVLNPRIVLTNYTDPFQYPPTYNASAYDPLVGAMVENPLNQRIPRPWYLYDHYRWPQNPSALHIASTWGGDLINFTKYSDPPTNFLGQTYNEFRANYDAAYSTRITLSLDGIYIDHAVWSIFDVIGPVPDLAPGTYEGNPAAIPPFAGITLPTGASYPYSIKGDWDLDEKPDSDGAYPPPDLGPPYGFQDENLLPNPYNTPDLWGSVDLWWRNGVVDFVSKLRANMGAGKFVFGNTGTWNQGLPGAFMFVLNGGVMESLIGQPYSYETTSFYEMMRAYTNIMAATSSPALQIFAQDGSLTDYQDMRYGLCACLQGDAYYYHSDGATAGGYHDVNWFDEFDNNLGAAVMIPGLPPYQHGVYRRDFRNGIALVNPKGNGSQTVTLETAFKHLTGSQAPGVNDGSTTSSVTLADRDGVILLRIP
jgi:Hypothetical glycosyl hydrolase family 15